MFNVQALSQLRGSITAEARAASVASGVIAALGFASALLPWLAVAMLVVVGVGALTVMGIAVYFVVARRSRGRRERTRYLAALATISANSSAGYEPSVSSHGQSAESDPRDVAHGSSRGTTTEAWPTAAFERAA